MKEQTVDSRQKTSKTLRLLLRFYFAPSALVLLLFAFASTKAHAHIGTKDVFETVTTGPYKLFVTVRMPNVIPGVATIDVQSSGAPIDTILIAPTPLTGEASLHPPTPDAMKRAPDDVNHYTGTLWIMASGSWEVRFTIAGAQGSAKAGVPITAVPVAMLKMERGMGTLLAVLGVVLMLGFAGLISAAVRESRLPPGEAPSPDRRKRAAYAFAGGLALAVLGVYYGGKWWNVEAADYADGIYRPAVMQTELGGNLLKLRIGDPDGKTREWKPININKVLLDHGKIMHLYAIRWPEMDVAYHLHPSITEAAKGRLEESLPAMAPGTYHLYGDIVHASGFPETMSATLDLPAGMQGGPLAADDAFAQPAPLSRGMLGTSYALPDGYTLRWDAPASLVVSKAYSFHFELLDAHGKPATDVVPYLGMAGHAAFVKTDGTVFAHTHPDGSAPMPSMMLANAAAGSGLAADKAMPDMAGMSHSNEPLPPVVDFPYGFPTAGRYRIFIQMKHSGTVETAAFDAEVH